MSDRTQANGFSEHHQLHARTTFQYIDKSLSEAEHIMIDAGSPSPFRRHWTTQHRSNAKERTITFFEFAKQCAG